CRPCPHAPPSVPPRRSSDLEAWTSSPHSLGITTGCPGGVTTLTHELLVPRSIPTAIASLIGCSPSALVRAILEGAWLGVNEGESAVSLRVRGLARRKLPNRF